MIQNTVRNNVLSITATKLLKYKQQLINMKIGGKYLITQRLGQGSFGQVYKGINLQTKIYVAIKQLFKYRINEIKNQKQKQLKLKYIQQEDQILSKLNHPNILKYYQTYENDDFKFIITEYCNQGTLTQMIQKYGSLSLQHSINILKQLCMAIIAMGPQVTHRDLKPDNIFIHNGRYIIGDFGLSKIISQNLVSNHTYCGTDYTQAPQVKTGKYSKNADIYSLGVILYIMLSPEGTIQQRGNKAKLIDFTNFTLKLKSGKQIPGPVKLFLKQSLQKQKSKRLSLHKLKNHQIFLMQNNDTIPNMYCINVNLQDINDTQLKCSKNRITIIQKQLSYHNYNYNQNSDNGIKSINSTNSFVPVILEQQQIKQKQYQDTKEMIKLCQTQEVYKILKQQSNKQNDIQTQIYMKLKQFHLYSKIAQFIYKRIILVIENKNLINLNQIENVQLMYMLSARCFMYLSRINDKSQKLRSQVKFQEETYHFIKRVQEFYNQCDKKFQEYSQKLKQKEDKMLNIVSTFFTKITKNQKFKENNKMLNGIEKIDYKRHQHVQWIQNKLNSIKKLNTKDQKLQQQMFDIFKVFTKINDIKLDQLKQNYFDVLVEKYLQQ